MRDSASGGAGYRAVDRWFGYVVDGMSVVSDLHMARVYLAQAKATPHREFRVTLLEWACNCTRRHARLREVRNRKAEQQLELFA